LHDFIFLKWAIHFKDRVHMANQQDAFTATFFLRTRMLGNQITRAMRGLFHRHPTGLEA